MDGWMDVLEWLLLLDMIDTHAFQFSIQSSPYFGLLNQSKQNKTR